MSKKKEEIKGKSLKAEDFQDKSFAEFVREMAEAIRVAEERQIQNNIIVLNDKYDELKEFYFALEPRPCQYVKHYYPTLLGKKLVLGNLPKKYFFAIGRNDNCFSKDEYIAKLEKENAELKDKLLELGAGLEW